MVEGALREALAQEEGEDSQSGELIQSGGPEISPTLVESLSGGSQTAGKKIKIVKLES